MRERGLNNLSIVLFLLLSFACDRSSDVVYIDAAQANIITRDGITYNEATPVTGVVFVLDVKGDTLSVSGYREGRLHGVSKKFYSRKQPQSVRYFENGMKVGEHRGWYANGQQSFLYHFEKDEYHGNQKEWIETGQIYSDMNYEHGRESGSQRVWYADGTIKTNYIIKNNRRYGLLGTKNCVNTADSVRSGM